MAIPEAQLDTWSRQGAIEQSKRTYQSVKTVLHDSSSPYYLKSFDSFLQGSYGNDTNVYRDSDVDVVMRLDSTWYHDANTLPTEQYQAFQRAHPGNADYDLSEFKQDVFRWLTANFGAGVRMGSKAIFIPGNNSRRDCDVLPCAKYKYYYRFFSDSDQRFAEGICFRHRDGTLIVNFPKQHSENCTHKHQQTRQWFKPTVRVFKNARNFMVDKNIIADGLAPSYFVEGLLWNVPNSKFGYSHESTFKDTLEFLLSADLSEFTCANGIHRLLRDNANVSWSPGNCSKFLGALRDLWNSWR